MSSHHTRPALRILLCTWLALSACGLFIADRGVANEPTGASQQQMTPATFERITNAFLRKYRPSRDGLVSQGDVLPLIDALEAHGLKLDRKAFLARIPSDQSPLVKLLRTPDGRKFMAQTSSNRLMYDRLDRLMREPGGPRMLHDLMKLPDAARYAKVDPGPGLPDLVDFLPKSRSGKTRRVKDYDQPTGQLYTMEDVVNALAAGLSPPKHTR